MLNVDLKAEIGKSVLDVRARKSGLYGNYVRLMDLGPDGENNPILSDDGKKRQRTFVNDLIVESLIRHGGTCLLISL